MNTKPCPFCGESQLQELTHGHKEGCFFDLMLRRGFSDHDYDEAWNLRRADTPQFTRAAWDSLGVVVSSNRIYLKGGRWIYCTWDGVESEFRPTLEDIEATDWRVL
jgi:hypothetical protein